MEQQEMEKVDFAKYEGKYNAEFFQQLRDNPENITVEQMREALYGYTCQEDYEQGNIPDWLMMDYWEEAGPDEDFEETYDNYLVYTPQEELLLSAIDSTGDGKTPETALCVIHVHQEYEYLSRVAPYCFLKKTCQRLLRNDIDCIEFAPNIYHINQIYFDVHRLFEKFYNGGRKKEER